MKSPCLSVAKRFHQIGILFMLIITSCVPIGYNKAPETPLVGTMPAPRVKIVSATSSEPEPDIEVIPTPNFSPKSSSLEELAENVHGDRLIDWIDIPKIGVFAPVSPVGWMPVSDSNYKTESQWDSAEAGVGWVVSSALPGDEANIVLYGHNNLNASVFIRLGDVEPGDEIRLRTGEGDWSYLVDQVMIVPASDIEEMDRAYRENFAPGEQSRLTVLSCWPPVNNTHRVIVIAYPAFSTHS